MDWLILCVVILCFGFFVGKIYGESLKDREIELLKQEIYDLKEKLNG